MSEMRLNLCDSCKFKNKKCNKKGLVTVECMKYVEEGYTKYILEVKKQFAVDATDLDIAKERLSEYISCAFEKSDIELIEDKKDEVEKYVSYDGNGSYEEFDTLQEAKDWLSDNLVDADMDGYDTDVVESSYIAKKVYQPTYEVIDRKSNYPCPNKKSSKKYAEDCDNCEDYDEKVCENVERWEYYSEFDYVGNIEFKKIN